MIDIFSLEGRIALVTGGSRGIGRMIAEGFLAQGATVFITARKAEACRAAAEEMSGGGGTCVAIPHDIATLEGARAVTDDLVRQTEGRLDILVNNAGTAWAADFEDFPEVGWDKVMALNLKTPFFLTQYLFAALKATARPDRPSKVVNIASIDGLVLSQLESYSYHASKAGLIHLTRRLAARLVRDGILVNAIAPGAFASDMNTTARDSADAVSALVPAGRIGRKSDMAGAAIYLAARSGDYVAGTTMIVDGGVALARLAKGVPVG